jgi:hypothetical protein
MWQRDVIRIVTIEVGGQPVETCAVWCHAFPVVPAVLHRSELFQAGRHVERIQQGYVFDLLQVHQAILPIVPAEALDQHPCRVPVPVERLHDRIEMLVGHRSCYLATFDQLQLEGHPVLVHFRNRPANAHFLGQLSDTRRRQDKLPSRFPGQTSGSPACRSAELDRLFAAEAASNSVEVA